VIEIAQSGFGATGRIRVVLVSASAHDPCLSKQLLQLSIGLSGRFVPPPWAFSLRRTQLDKPGSRGCLY
jgi:hypothetical protein